MADACACNEITTMVFACSGGSDVGGLSDRVARKLARDGKAKMYCLAGVGAGLPNMVSAAGAVKKRIVIDGCPVNCARKIMEKAGLTAEFHNLKDLGFEKGKSQVDDTVVSGIAEKIA